MSQRPPPRPPQEAEPRHDIFWIASYPRSGNTWLRVLIHNLMNVMRGVSDAGQELAHLDRYTTWESLAKHFRPFIAGSLADADWREITRVRPAVQAALAARGTGSIFAKTHQFLGRVDGVQTINPEVTRGAVYLVRNPLDVVCSLAPHLGRSLDDAITALGTFGFLLVSTEAYAYEVCGSWSQNVESWTGQPAPLDMVIRYEDLMADPVKVFGAFIAKIGMRPGPGLVERAVELSAFSKLQRQEKEHGFAESARDATDAFFRKGRSGGWRETLSAEQVARIVEAHGKQMKRFGYLEGL